MVSIHGPLGYEPNTLTTAPLRWCLRLQSLGVGSHLVLARRRGHVDMIESRLLHGLNCCACHFARVVKGVDSRSTAGNCAWARTPQLTYHSTVDVGSWLGAASPVPICQSMPAPQSLLEHGVTCRAASRSMLGVATGLLHAAPTQPPTTAERMPKASAMMTEPMHRM